MAITSDRTWKSTGNDGMNFVPLPGRQVALSIALSFGTAAFFRVPTDAERARRPG